MHTNLKGILLLSGTGSRLSPLTQAFSKHLFLVYDKPMFYYPLSTLMSLSIREIALICHPRDEALYRRLLGNGEQWGLHFTYIQQTEAKGIPDALILAKNFLSSSPVAMILGDNFFSQCPDLDPKLAIQGALLYSTEVDNASAFGMIDYDPVRQCYQIIEKPSNSRSRQAVTGLYIYDSSAPDRAEQLPYSHRQELEITDLNNQYCTEQLVTLCSFSAYWADMGTPLGVYHVSHYVKCAQEQHHWIGYPEIIARQQDWLSHTAYQQCYAHKTSIPYYHSLEQWENK